MNAPISLNSKEKLRKEDLMNLNSKSWQIVDGYNARSQHRVLNTYSAINWPKLYAAKYIG